MVVYMIFPKNACSHIWEYFYWDDNIKVKYWTGESQSVSCGLQIVFKWENER